MKNFPYNAFKRFINAKCLKKVKENLKKENPKTNTKAYYLRHLIRFEKYLKISFTSIYQATPLRKFSWFIFQNYVNNLFLWYNHSIQFLSHVIIRDFTLLWWRWSNNYQWTGTSCVVDIVFVRFKFDFGKICDFFRYFGALDLA